MTDRAIGVVGLGGMGSGMAGHLLANGWTVRVWNRSAAPAEALAARGAQVAATPAEAAAMGMVITMVANDAALEAVTLGEDGVADGLPVDGVHLSMSTVSPGLVRRLSDAHAARGATLVSAPVFGRPDAAGSGKLWIMCAGPAEAQARVKPLLETLSQGIADLGEAPEAAALGKIAGNFMIAAATEAMAEAFALLRKGGADPRAWHALLARGPFGCPIYANYGRFMLDGAFDPPGFKLALGLKDVNLAMAAATETATPMPFAGVLRDRLTASLAQGRGELDWTSIAINAARDAGLEG